MAIVRILGPVTNDLSEVGASGTVSYEAAGPSGAHGAIRFNFGTSTTGYAEFGSFDANGTLNVNFNLATAWFKGKLKINTAPASDSCPVLLTRNSSAATKCELRVNSARKLEVYNQTGTTLLGTSTTALTVGTEHEIDFKIPTGTSAAFELWIDGVSEISGTGDFTATNLGPIRLGRPILRASVACDWQWSCMAVDDSTRIGAGVVTRQALLGNGSSTQWSAGTANNKSEVDDCDAGGTTDTDTTYIQKSSGASQSHLFTLTSTATSGITGTPKAHLTIARCRETAGGTTAVILLRVRSGGINSDSSTKNNYSTTYILTGKVTATDPSTSAAWTLAGLDAAEVGVADTSTETAVRCTTIVSAVLWQPASETSTVDKWFRELQIPTRSKIEVKGYE
jgi:hypothetical protein